MLVKELNTIAQQRAKNVLRGGSLTEVIQEGDLVIKLYRGKHARGFNKLKKEVEYIKSLPANLQPFYPEIVEIIDAKGIYAYSMPYYAAMDSMTNEMLGNADLSYIWQKICEVNDFMETAHYPAASKQTADNYVDDVIHQRLCDAIEALSPNPAYKEILDGGLIVDGVELLPAKEIHQRLLNDKFTNEHLFSSNIEFFHGNFHMGNILINRSDFILIDPRGDTLGSKLYDSCKMFVHLLTRYDEIHTDRFTYNSQVGNVNVVLTDTRVGARYDHIQKKLLDQILAKTDLETFTSQVAVLGGAHALSFSSYHARKNDPSEDRAKAYLIAGMSLLTRYLEGYGLDLSQPLFRYSGREDQA